MENQEMELGRDLFPRETVIFRVGGENDGPGYIIYVGSDGKLHVKRVPGWDPGVRIQFNAAASILVQAAKLEDAKLEERLVAHAQDILAPIAQQMYKSTIVK